MPLRTLALVAATRSAAVGKENVCARTVNYAFCRAAIQKRRKLYFKYFKQIVAKLFLHGSFNEAKLQLTAAD